MVASKAEPKKTKEKTVREKAISGKCLICTKDAEIRGLCSKHYAAYRREYDRRDSNEKANFETESIRNGMILAQQDIRTYRRPNPFAGIER